LWRYAQAIALIGFSDTARGSGIHARISPPARWQRMGSARRQRSIRIALLRKLSTMHHIPERVLREEYMTLFSLLVEHAPERYTEDLHLDADELNFFLHDRERSESVVKRVQEEVTKREKAPPYPAPQKGIPERGTQSTLF
ncbi:MAG: replication factor C large subunit, partial [Methanomicrobiales archaeon]|nr:replication factor C large subunit [Methanomicrobiales archaeon]